MLPSEMSDRAAENMGDTVAQVVSAKPGESDHPVIFRVARQKRFGESLAYFNELLMRVLRQEVRRADSHPQ